MAAQTALLVIGRLPIKWVVELFKTDWDLIFWSEIPEAFPLNLRGVVLGDLGEEGVLATLQLRLRTQVPIIVVGQEFPGEVIVAGADRYVSASKGYRTEFVVQIKAAVRYANVHGAPPLVQSCTN